ncbi:MAG: LacI family DNA-binding transcriptional regulator [Lentisphaerota bacterium]
MTKNKKSRDTTSSRNITVVDVAKAAGASQAAVSYVINNRPGVGPELRKKILAIMKEMNYTPSPAARHLSREKSDMLGIVIQDLGPGWFHSVFQGMLIQATMSSHHVITSVSVREGDTLELVQRMIAKTSVDGLLWLDPRATPEVVRKFKETGMPFVLVQNDPSDPDVNTIATENRLGARDAARHLLALGYRRILLMTGHEENSSSREKLEGVQQAFRDVHLPLPSNRILDGQYNGEIAVHKLEAYLGKDHPRPEAVFAFNDDMALALLRWLRQKNIRVPEDIAMVGFDGTDEARQAGLTTVETPTRDLGIMAAQLLMAVINNPSRNAQHILLQGTLCVRDTCGARLRKPS